MDYSVRIPGPWFIPCEEYELCEKKWYRREPFEREETPDVVSGQLRLDFTNRANRWEKEAAIHSSPAARFLHKDYQWVISRGEEIVPLILERLKTSRKDWFWALEQITEENPAKDAESFSDAAKLWIEWGQSRR